MNETTPTPLAHSSQENEIILYQPDSTVRLEVRRLLQGFRKETDGILQNGYNDRR